MPIHAKGVMQKLDVDHDAIKCFDFLDQKTEDTGIEDFENQVTGI